MGHPQYFVARRGLQWATPPHLGRVLVLLCYWIVMAYFMAWEAVKKDIYFWERIGYRNAWLTVTQLPMLYLLSMKVNVIGFLIGTGHERLNWLHRWVARTMLITATMHGFHFWTEWELAGFVKLELEAMPMVKYGLGMWAILLWNVVTGILPIRRLAYEAWVVQHVLSSIAMLVLLHMHIPAYARYNLWMAISFLAFDRAARWFILLWQNLRFKPNRDTCQGMKRIGHNVSAKAVGPATTLITIKDVHFKWAAGQHLYLWLPRVGPIEAHPYTIACAHQTKGSCCCNSIQLIVRTHGGFSKRIHSYASKNPDVNLTGFVSGPYGVPPRWDIYETMVLIGASTGASFILPILESVANVESKTCLARIEVVMMARKAEEIEYYVTRAREAGRKAREKGVIVRLHVAITGSGGMGNSLVKVLSQTDSDSIHGAEKPEATNEKEILSLEPRADSLDSSRGSVWTPEFIREYTTRPDIEALIREPVEQAWGETAVVVCGGKEVVARTRNCVSRLSDERAVHKGTGAQGIYLHAEEYSF